MASNGLDSEFQKITEARHHDPFAVLGKHRTQHQEAIRAYFPYATEVIVAEGERPMKPVADTGIFQWSGDIGTVPDHYQLIWWDRDRHQHIAHDPYTFAPQVPDFDLHLFGEGRHWHAYRFLGSHVHEINGIAGILFVVWAPNAERVSVVGEFNRWDGRCHPMRVRGGSGVWELFVPDLTSGVLYKYEIRNRNSGELVLKSDPYAQQYEVRPQTASITTANSGYGWGDQVWMEKRRHHDWQHAPMSIYEVHLGSWKRGPDGAFLTYRDFADQLVSYVLEMGFSHIELLPITEHPYDPSWGYQTTGYFAPTSRFGKPDDLRYLVDQCHQNNLGVILDWVPAHFPKDAHGLARFDGSALYEHEDPRMGEHLDWSTLIYNFSRNEVKNFLLSSAMYWLEEFHLDGLRVDAVASMLYLDYSRTDWVPNKYGGRENLDAIEFLQQLNTAVHEALPGVLMFAEESTSWPQVSRPVHLGGLGFDIKWNMGWMNDTLSYMSNEAIHRKYHHDMLTFSMLYAFTENFLLPFSHDEVVHGKQSMLHKMPGDEWQKFANLRLLYTYMFAHPGKKLLFMGTEFAQGVEWNSTQSMDWYVLDYAYHQGVQRLVKDLNKIYHQTPALHHYEFDWRGFEWIDCHDSDQSVMSFVRRSDNDFLIVIVNFTPVPRENYRIGVPQHGAYQEIFNSDSEYYGGSNLGNGPNPLYTEDLPWMEKAHSLTITLPPLASIILKPQ